MHNKFLRLSGQLGLKFFWVVFCILFNINSARSTWWLEIITPDQATQGIRIWHRKAEGDNQPVGGNGSYIVSTLPYGRKVSESIETQPDPATWQGFKFYIIDPTEVKYVRPGKWVLRKQFNDQWLLGEKYQIGLQITNRSGSIKHRLGNDNISMWTAPILRDVANISDMPLQTWENSRPEYKIMIWGANTSVENDPFNEELMEAPPNLREGPCSLQ